MYTSLNINSNLLKIVLKIEDKIEGKIKEFEKLVTLNQARVLKAFQNNQISDFHLKSSTGYGYDDIGREKLDKVYAEVFQSEAALVRPHIVSGTHALTIGLFGLLRPGDELLYITGKPYDTLEKVIGIDETASGSLKEWGISYKSVSLKSNGRVDYEKVADAINSRTKVIGIQRSRGYSYRSSFSLEDIKVMIKFVKEIKPNIIILIDNCYGEFTEINEPTYVGADLIIGSLIKNPGGGLAKGGGYFAGKKEFIDLISYRLTAPGIGSKVGSMYGYTNDLYQGFFLAPHFVGEALKGGVFISALFEELGFETSPKWFENRYDIIQAVKFSNPDALLTFLQGIQKNSPIDSHVVPEPADIPGYQHPVIMAAGTFVQGASLELSADAPYKEPYIGYVQGGLTYQHIKLAIINTVEMLLKKGIIKFM